MRPGPRRKSAGDAHATAERPSRIWYYAGITSPCSSKRFPPPSPGSGSRRRIQSFNQNLRKQFGITGLQLSVLRILGERPALPLAALRKALVMHPATLGQSIDELRVMGLCTVTRNPKDKRARQVAITEKGSELVARVPVAGPMLLRETENDPARLDRMKAAFEDAIELFGLTGHVPGKTAGR